MSAPSLDTLKQQAAQRAVEFVEDGMVVGLGTGSTAKHVIAALGQRVRTGLRIHGVPTSSETAALATAAGIPLLEAERAWTLDVAIDGADQIDPQFNLIKGGGGALLKEKIVAASARRFVVVADHTKQVPHLGKAFPLPIEVIPFGWGSTARHLEQIGGTAQLRTKDGQTFRTECGHYIVDLTIGPLDDPAEWERRLHTIPGVVETGLFVGRTHVVILGTPTGVTVQTHA
ncbi:MAG: ribose-5-phosphate isomerase RpiA [Nitrospiraceae bacterium]